MESGGNWRFELPSSSSSKYDYSDDYVGYDEEYDDDDVDDGGGGVGDGGDGSFETDYPCPFCTDDFDIVGLCCHIEEEHYDEARKGFCTICDTSVGDNLVEHIVSEHGIVYKSGRKSKRSHGDSQSTLGLMRKELLDKTLKSLLESSSSVASSSNAAVDQMLTSFICSYSTPAEADSKPSISPADVVLEEDLTDQNALERSMKKCAISDEKQEEQAQRSKFVQSLLLSTFLDDGL